MPLLVGVPGLILSLAQLAIDTIGRGGPAEKTEHEMAMAAADRSKGRSESADVRLAGRLHRGDPGLRLPCSAGRCWCCCSSASPPAAPGPARSSPGAGTLLVLWGMFNWLLGVPLFPGLLADWIGI